ncbi:putative DNA primase [Propionibacterium phage PHL114L00]|uniref:Putative DNA primase n=1 Tax=Propionibacterium phage PHL114L00 TaxID=1235656 RepID=T1R5V1_9CAUD|nr:putative DNA primase [Propionibacterium phage PHL114L00]AGI12842.1 putative DNA primase [Propionibacterium phage PHL114L00]
MPPPRPISHTVQPVQERAAHPLPTPRRPPALHEHQPRQRSLVLPHMRCRRRTPQATTISRRKKPECTTAYAHTTLRNAAESRKPRPSTKPTSKTFSTCSPQEESAKKQPATTTLDTSTMTPYPATKTTTSASPSHTCTPFGGGQPRYEKCVSAAHSRTTAKPTTTPNI